MSKQEHTVLHFNPKATENLICCANCGFIELSQPIYISDLAPKDFPVRIHK
jgi:hypothetical protein